jgi:hypothetical protein
MSLLEWGRRQVVATRRGASPPVQVQANEVLRRGIVERDEVRALVDRLRGMQKTIEALQGANERTRAHLEGVEAGIRQLRAELAAAKAGQAAAEAELEAVRAGTAS